jgi:hypothetical protein
MNFTVNKSIGMSPYEVLNNKGPFDWCSKQLESNIQLKLNDSLQMKKKNECKRNKKRIKLKYSQGMNVMIKKHNPDKIEDKWKGPCEIVEVSSFGNRIKTFEGNKIGWHNIKNVRPFLCRKGVDVSVISRHF